MASGTAFDGRTMTLNDGKLLPNFGSSVTGFLAGGETGRGGWVDCSGIGISFFLYCATKLETDLLLIGTAIAGATGFLAASLTTGALEVGVVATLGCSTKPLRVKQDFFIKFIFNQTFNLKVFIVNPF